MLVARARTALAAVVLTPLAVGCAALGGGGESSASCAFVVDYRDSRYIDVGRVEYELGSKVGTARQAICDDEGGGGEDAADAVAAEDRTVYTAYAIKGVDPADAIAVRESPDGELSVMVDPSEDESLRDAQDRIFGRDDAAGDGDGGEEGDGEGGNGGTDGPSAAKCVFVVKYAGEGYLNRGEADFELGERLGTARTTYCDDTPGDVDPTPEPEVYEAYAVKGLDPADAIAVRLSADEEPMFMTSLGDDLPQEVLDRLKER
ncbi:DUF6281 family protein [Streptomyces neyagawaensis]|uniref:DUF6281 family protein n=2 Tax=Streptomyces neyagawaensis TaxID=42238 RepID=UPI00201D1BD0|nr:DUF6281 family protein [Streptomyces neyagawaensis]MCL6736070.1 DUF6281 family protein [Streptomyces neyagawaensis]MDE1684108.1 DUF6281 family protein [Streptomyces neyagawaensis]